MNINPEQPCLALKPRRNGRVVKTWDAVPLPELLVGQRVSVRRWKANHIQLELGLFPEFPLPSLKDAFAGSVLLAPEDEAQREMRLCVDTSAIPPVEVSHNKLGSDASPAPRFRRVAKMRPVNLRPYQKVA